MARFSLRPNRKRTALQDIRDQEYRQNVDPKERLEPQKGEASYVDPKSAARPRPTTRAARRAEVIRNQKEGRGKRRGK